MALALIEIVEGRSADEKRGMVQAVRAALGEALQAPAEDPTVRLTEYPHEQFSRSYPDRHSERYTLVSVTMFAGRSMQAKRSLYGAVVRGLAPFGVSPEDVVITLHELPMENWGVNGGSPASEIDVGFKVDI